MRFDAAQDVVAGDVGLVDVPVIEERTNCPVRPFIHHIAAQAVAAILRIGQVAGAGEAVAQLADLPAIEQLIIFQIEG